MTGFGGDRHVPEASEDSGAKQGRNTGWLDGCTLAQKNSTVDQALAHGADKARRGSLWLQLDASQGWILCRREQNTAPCEHQVSHTKDSAQMN
jgi:hypothetical protein